MYRIISHISFSSTLNVEINKITYRPVIFYFEGRFKCNVEDFSVFHYQTRQDAVLISAMDGREGSVSHPGHFTNSEETPHRRTKIALTHF